MRAEKIPFQAALALIFQIWKRNYLQFQRSWLISLFWIVIEPVFILGAMGFGLGSYVTNINGRSYADFFFPALLCTSSMFVTYFVSTYDNFSKLTHQKVFQTQMLSMIEPREIAIGEILWAATKGTFSAMGVSLVASAFGLVETLRIFPAFIVIFISCILFAAFGLIITTFVRNFDQIIYPSSGLIIPMSLFCDTYFPIESLPWGLKYITYIFPLTSSVGAVRDILHKGFYDYTTYIKILYLVLFAFILVRFSIHRLSKKLLD